MKSDHVAMKANAPAAKSELVESGSTIRVNTRIGLQPSMAAASSSSTGKVR
jgi:hypothetical protein